jgi:hypothetical protein
MTGPLISDLLSISLTLILPILAISKAFGQAVSEQAIRELQPSVAALIKTFFSAFIILFHEHEAACTDADLPRILQEIERSGSYRIAVRSSSVYPVQPIGAEVLPGKIPSQGPVPASTTWPTP